MKNINPKLFFYSAIFVGFGIELYTLANIFSLNHLGEMFLTMLGLNISFFIFVYILERFNILINLPFVSDLVDEPKSPVYRLSNESWRSEYQIVKSEVGSAYFDSILMLLCPLIFILRYKTMVDEEETFEFEFKLLEFYGSLGEEYEEMYQEKHKERLRKEEIQNNRNKVIADLNKEYEENFKK